MEGEILGEEAECEALGPAELKEIKFMKWTKAGHLRPLYIKAHVNKKPIARVLIDGGAVFDAMPYSTVEKLGKSHKDLKKTNMTMSNFIGENASTLGVLTAELIVGSKTTITFFLWWMLDQGTLSC